MEKIKILYQDDDLVAIDKNYGAVIHGGRGVPKESPILSQSLPLQLGRDIYPVHRLDRPTSGILVFAFSSEIASIMASDIRAHQWKKRYIGLIRGPMRDGVNLDYAIKEDGVLREAQTDFDPIKTYRKRYTLIQAFPLTGRYHQIRLHLKHLRHPLVGDTNYGNGPINRFFREEFGLHRLFLHAARLQLPHPTQMTRLDLECELPGELKFVLEKLEKYEGKVV